MIDQMGTIPQKTNSNRKLEHLNIALNENIGSKDLPTVPEAYRFVHRAPLEVDLSDIDLPIELLPKELNAPIILSPIVRGMGQAMEINRNMARA